MKSMKRVLTICLAAAITVSLVGCKKETKKSENNVVNSTNEMNNLTDVDPDMIDPPDPGMISQISEFPKFQAKDLEGNEVDDSIFSEHAVTVMNFWYNGCPSCITEIPEFDKMNNELKEKGGVVIGVNTDAANGEIEPTKEILKKVKCSYQNIYFDLKTEAGKIANDITTFPTTLVIDRNGKIVGEPISGSIEYEDVMKRVKDRIEEVLEKDK